MCIYTLKKQFFFKYLKKSSDERTNTHLALLFTSMLTHRCLPDAFMTTSIILILKNNNGDPSL